MRPNQPQQPLLGTPAAPGLPHPVLPPAGRTGAYIGSPELGPVNYFQTGEIRRPNAPLARDPWACRRLMDASLLILREVDPELAHNKWAAISPDGQVGRWWVCAAWGGGGADPSPTRLPLELPYTHVYTTDASTHTPLPPIHSTQVLVDRGYASKVLPADGTSGTSGRNPLGPKTGGVAIWHDAAGVTGRTASSIGRRPAPFLALFRRLLMSKHEC